jgi:pimeloyl-ACP methyl ester carboxylesterase
MGASGLVGDVSSCQPALAAQALNALVFSAPRRRAEELAGLLLDKNFVLIQPTEALGDPVPVAGLYFRRNSSQTTLLYSHGNAEDLIDMRGTLQQISAELDVDILAYDYPGYGSSAGPSSEAACHHALRKCFDYLLREGCDRSSILLMGRSLGSGPTIELASTESGLCGVILQSPFLSILRTQLSSSIARTMAEVDMFNNVEKIQHVKCPVFIMHGMTDVVVPVSHGQELHGLAIHSLQPWWVESRGHNDLSDDEEFVMKLSDFLDVVQAQRRRQFLEAAASFSSKMMVFRRPSNKLILNAI